MVYQHWNIVISDAIASEPLVLLSLLHLRRFSHAKRVDDLKFAIEKLDIALDNLFPDMLSRLQVQIKNPQTGRPVVPTRKHFPSGVLRALMPQVPSFIPLSFGSAAETVLIVVRECVEMLKRTLSEPLTLDENLIDQYHDLVLSLYLLSRYTTDSFFINSAVDLERTIMTLLPNAKAKQAKHKHLLSDMLLSQFDQTHNAHVLPEAIALQRQVVQLDLYVSIYPRSNLVAVLQRFYDHTGNEEILDEAIDVQRSVLEDLPLNHPESAALHLSLSTSLKRKYRHSVDVDALRETVELERSALRICPTNHPDRSRYLYILGTSLWTLFSRVHDLDTIMESVALLQAALSLRPVGHPEHAETCGSLARSLYTLALRTDDTHQLDKAITLLRRQLVLQPPGHPNRAEACLNLGSTLASKYVSSRDRGWLEEAEGFYRESLSLRPPGDRQRYEPCLTMANCLQMRYALSNNQKLLEESIDLFLEALNLVPRDSPVGTEICIGITSSLVDMFRVTGDVSYLNDAVSYGRRGLESFPSTFPLRKSAFNNMASALQARFDCTADEVLVNEASELRQRARKDYTYKEKGYLSLGPNTANNQRDNDKDVDVSQDSHIEFLRSSLRSWPEEHPGWADAQSQLASAVVSKFKTTGNEELLEEAIDLQRHVVEVLSRNNRERAPAYGTLGAILRIGYMKTRNEYFLEQAVRARKESLALSPPGNMYRWRALLGLTEAMLTPDTIKSDEFDIAVGYTRDAIEAGAYEHWKLLEWLVDLLRQIPPDELPISTAKSLLQIYVKGANTLSLVSSLALDARSHLKLTRLGSNLSSDAFTFAALAEDPQTGLELLEQARALLWSQALNMRNPQLDAVPGNLAQELRHLLQTLSARHTAERAQSQPLADATQRDLLHQHNTRVQQIINEVRMLPGFQRFMLGPEYTSIVQCASANPVIVLTASRTRAHALVMKSPTNIQCIDFDSDQVGKLMDRLANAFDKMAGLGNQSGRGMGISKALSGERRVLAQIWTTIVKPVLDRLEIKPSSGRKRPRIHWCPTGRFTFMPLHAAGIYDAAGQECCSDYVVSSYTPTLSGLSRARAGFIPLHRQNPNLLAVAEPDAPGKPGLYQVKKEVESLNSINENDSGFNVECVISPNVEAVLERLPQANIFHLACHGIQNWQDALDSGFCLHDGNLKITQLMRMDLKNAFLAYLSACETAKGDRVQPDQTVHLAAAMLFAGFRSVIATMWNMNDVDGPVVAVEVYRSLFSTELIDADAIPYALDNAIQKLRGQGIPPERWATFIHMGA